MVSLFFENAEVRDDGYGLTVNGKDLCTILSEALGTRVGTDYGYGSDLPAFKSNCCDVRVIIEPKAQYTKIETDTQNWGSIEAMEEDLSEQFREKAEKAGTEE